MKRYLLLIGLAVMGLTLSLVACGGVTEPVAVFYAQTLAGKIE